MCIRNQKRNRRGYTILEMMVAILILAAVTTLAYMTFSTATTAWKKGTALVEKLHHGDFVMEQLVMALRSAYYPWEAGKAASAYGLQNDDSGDGEFAMDRISWVKTGSSLVGGRCLYSGGPHRVRFGIEEENGVKSVCVRSWRVQGQSDDFDPEKDADRVCLSTNITGFNCRTAYRKVGGEIEWLDKWEETNRLPTVVEIKLYMAPLEEGENPVEIKRIVGIPVAPLAWR